jgi:toxin ParE1/3/4
MRELIRSFRYEEDLISIWRYVAGDSPEAASLLLERIDERVQSLIQNPFIGERQSQFGARTRRIIDGNYIVFYDVHADVVHVLRVFHGARKLESLLD